jgi:hypothetical protein
VVISAWGGAIPYVGPLFGYSADGTGAWQWSLTHTVLALAPGVVGVLCGLTFLTPVRTSSIGRRFGLGLAGIIAVAAGAWFVIGPVAWPVISDVGRYFVPAPPFRNLLDQLGYSLGPGLILAACGAFAIGWAARHNRPLGATPPVAPSAAVADVPVGPTRPVQEQGPVPDGAGRVVAVQGPESPEPDVRRPGRTTVSRNGNVEREDQVHAGTHSDPGGVDPNDTDPADRVGTTYPAAETTGPPPGTAGRPTDRPDDGPGRDGAVDRPPPEDVRTR